jgi:release factor glutamine methyltransferase
LTAEVLLSHALGHERVYLFAHPEEELSDLAWLHYGRYLHERLNGKPTQYITKRQEFWGREFLVTPDVLIPRPETEHVVEEALRASARRIVDAGTGSGAIAVTLALETAAEVWATDISEAALRIARRNAQRLGAQVRFVECDLVTAFAVCTFDLVVSNPPYVARGDEAGLQREVREWEPRVALFAGETGFESYERLISDAPRVLRPGGCLIMELGYTASEAVRQMLGDWHEVRLGPDLAGIPRVVVARR